MPRIIGALILGAGLAAPAHAQNGRVSGVVRDDAGQPLKGATIIAESPAIGQSFTSITDDKGRFNFLGLRSGDWRLIAQARGYSPEAGMLTVRSGGQNPPVAFNLKHSGVAFFGALAGVTGRDLQADLAAADALYEQHRWDEAIAAYRAVLGKVPVITSLNLQIGAAYRNKKDYDNAIAAYNALLKSEPANERARLEIAMTELQRGNLSAADAALVGPASRPDASRELCFGMGEIKLAASEPDAAAMWFERAAKADPYWAKPLLQLGQAALRKGDNAEAERLLTRAIQVDPTAPEAGAAKTTLESLKKP
ncbi:MAG: tetratricopeptide repeat protein [Acidobacteria bacterium]|nr:tetratricopeptide repeat protein [Acidobacteriota bacterium]